MQQQIEVGTQLPAQVQHLAEARHLGESWAVYARGYHESSRTFETNVRKTGAQRAEPSAGVRGVSEK